MHGNPGPKAIHLQFNMANAQHSYTMHHHNNATSVQLK